MRFRLLITGLSAVLVASLASMSTLKAQPIKRNPVADRISLPENLDRPVGVYVLMGEDEGTIIRRDDAAGIAAIARILYVNRCAGGETFTPGWNDSRNNVSSIVSSTTTLPQYPYGNASWQQVMQHTRDIFSPFGISVTDQDPGNVPHFEAVVCGHPTDIGMEDGVGGVAPYNCGVIDNAITFTFPEIWGNSPRNIAETIGQEAAHGWGLDHEYKCEDPMTYLFGCGDKTFQNQNIACGEYSARACQCGGNTQNSYQLINALFGSAAPTPPDVTITSPADDADVDQGFVIRATISDPDGVQRAELFIDGSHFSTIQSSPYIFNAPSNLTEGGHSVIVYAYDELGTVGSDEIDVIIGPRCTETSCADDQICYQGQCVPGMGADGGLGEDCTAGSDCASGICGSAGGNSYCTDYCTVEANDCPEGFSCLSAGDNGVCWPGAGGEPPAGDDDDDDDDGGSTGGCTISRDHTEWPWTGFAFALVVGLALIRGRRRR